MRTKMQISDVNYRISKLPKWAQDYIRELEEKAIVAERYAESVIALAKDYPIVKPDLQPSEDRSEIINGWLAFRDVNCYSSYSSPRIEKACTNGHTHSVGLWDKTTSQRSISLFSSPSLALKSLLPEITTAYRNEISITLKKIEECK